MIKKCIDENELFGIVGNEFVMDDNISNEIVSIYTVMRTVMFDIKRCCSVLNLQTLYDVLSIDSKNGSKFIKQVKDSIQWLIDNEYIELYDMRCNRIGFDGKSQSVFRVSFMQEDENNIFDGDGGFTKIPECNMVCILNYIARNKGMKKYQFIRYYLAIARQCSNDQLFGYISMDKLGEIVGVTSTTCADWNMILQQLNCIYYNNDYGHITKKGTFKMDCTMFGHSNVYNQYKQTLTKEGFDYSVETRASETKIVKVDKAQISNKKSVAQKKVWEDRKNTL